MGPEDTRGSLISRRSLENVLEGPAQKTLGERAVSCSVSSLVLLKTEAARSPYPAPLLSLTEGFWSQMDSPLQEAPALLPSAQMARVGLSLVSLFGIPVMRKALPWPFREPGDRQGPELHCPLTPDPLPYSYWAELWGAGSLGEGTACLPSASCSWFV